MSDRSEDGAIVPFGVFHSFDIRSASGSSTGAALVVADFVNDEQEVDEIAGGAELFIISVWVGPCTQKLATPLLEELELLAGKDLVVEYPCRGSCTGLSVVGIEG